MFFLRMFGLTFIAAPAVVAAHATQGVAGKPRKLQLVSSERVATLEQDSQAQWRAYLKKSEDRFDREQAVMSEEFRQAGLSAPQPAPNTSAQFAVDSKKQDDWYSSDESIKLAETVISFQTQTFKPLFAGAQDGIVYDTFSEMASKNKVAYDYFTTKPGELIDKEMTRWKKRISK